MISDEFINESIDPSEMDPDKIPESHGQSGAIWMRSKYEALIKSGELIVRSELEAFLNTEDAMTSSGNSLRQQLLEKFGKP